MTKTKRVSKKIGQVSNKVRQLSKVSGQEQSILEFFYQNPEKKLTVRTLAQKLKMSSSTVHYYLKLLKEKGIVSEKNQWIDSWKNRLYKTNYYVEKIAESGLVEFLDRELAASAIILFGSIRKGESIKESDIDIFVEGARQKKLDLKEFEKKLGHNIQLFVKPKIKNLSKPLLNNVANGIKLKGYFTIK